MLKQKLENLFKDNEKLMNSKIEIKEMHTNVLKITIDCYSFLVFKYENNVRFQHQDISFNRILHNMQFNVIDILNVNKVIREHLNA